jgi:hypothetical protein
VALRTVSVTRYVAPLRQGGSLPAIVEADDDGLYVVKFRGAAQGQRTLVAEVIVGEIARVLGLLVPELVLAELDEAIGRSEPDYEIRELLRRSTGCNLGLDYLPGSIDYSPLMPAPPAGLAATIVWLDAYASNVDRTVKNPNMLLWHKRLWLIDHGAALYFHHAWDGYMEKTREPFRRVGEHPLLPFVTRAALKEADVGARRVLTDERLREIVGLVPDEWLDEPAFESLEAHRAAYVGYLAARRDASESFVGEIPVR